MSVTIQDDITDLLQQAGAVPPRYGRGKWTCAECHHNTLSVNTEKQVFNCHHAGCEFKGGIGTLRKRLGIEREWLPKDEYIRQMRECERAHEAALRLYSQAHQRQLELREELRQLGRLELAAHDAGPTKEAWEILATVYTRRPAIEQQLDAVESDDPAIVLEPLRCTRKS